VALRDVPENEPGSRSRGQISSIHILFRWEDTFSIICDPWAYYSPRRAHLASMVSWIFNSDFLKQHAFHNPPIHGALDLRGVDAAISNSFAVGSSISIWNIATPLMKIFFVNTSKFSFVRQSQTYSADLV
jgi:hypothetical protein